MPYQVRATYTLGVPRLDAPPDGYLPMVDLLFVEIADDAAIGDVATAVLHAVERFLDTLEASFRQRQAQLGQPFADLPMHGSSLSHTNA